MWFIKDRIDDEAFIEVCKAAKTMADAASTLALHFNSFKKRALFLGCYRPNQAGISIRKNAPKIPLDHIIRHGLHPQYQSFKLKRRLIEEGMKKEVCEICGISEWNGKKLLMELHHIDGQRTNQRLENLMLLCPNCHSQTVNFRAKNKKI